MPDYPRWKIVVATVRRSDFPPHQLGKLNLSDLTQQLTNDISHAIAKWFGDAKHSDQREKYDLLIATLAAICQATAGPIAAILVYGGIPREEAIEYAERIAKEYRSQTLRKTLELIEDPPSLRTN